MSNQSKPVVFEHGQTFLATISERWNYQILREVFFGTTRFGEIKRALGISANILTTRLNDLTELGLLSKRAYREDKPWYEYQLTDVARELVVPAIVAITRWAEERESGVGRSEGSDGSGSGPDGSGVRRPLLHTTCGNETEPYLACSACHEPIAASNLVPLVASTN
ncbi:helix-turn-helix transcriptional regulator [Catenulispora sp. NF23]|uniref:Helix-turn-helix transcriptional regulator n=1 Tax=Catenulispora pinistramenti TaxID=2705254 RepID=A0ABS5L6X9_9ACTN|nr:helix-turn-helix domain-containing protein [Catenulispora pinistramenti]MBS2533802.1 helix-turn-helix transcriptional regulator [Catenulispora pinistramenti]MBS2553990.1 helix-turn-helix transcriptional regulator [Catenulispora pinistramenti]